MKKQLTCILSIVLLVVFLFTGQAYAEEAQTIVYYDSLDELAAALRADMIARQPNCTIGFNGIDNAPTPDEIKELAMAHVGIPNAGDYLVRSTTACGGQVLNNTTDGVVYYFSMTYYTTAEQELAVDMAVADALKEIDTSGGYNTVRSIFKYIQDNVTYDHYHLDTNSSSVIRQTAYGAIVEGTAVCEGIATLFYRLCLECGVDARVIIGKPVGRASGHAWNIVDVDGNGVYYECCPTNDYFLTGSSVWSEIYTRFDQYKTEDFLSSYPVAEDGYSFNLDYSYDSDSGTLTISSDSVEKSFYTDSLQGNEVPAWSDEIKTTVKSIVIEAGAERIGEGMFSGFTALESVNIPDSVKSIGNNAFEGCSRLTGVSLPTGLKEIGVAAFRNCESLTDISLPNGVKNISERAFEYCTSLTTVNLPDNLVSIGSRAFYSCAKLENIDFPESLRFLGANAFSYCSKIESIKIPEGTTEIEESAFYGCNSLVNVYIPASVVAIGDAAFKNCWALKELVLPDGVELIGKEAFSGCTKLFITALPEALKSLGEYAFYECDGIGSIEIPRNLTRIPDYAFADCGLLSKLSLHEDVSSIGSNAFNHCGLVNVSIPAGVKEIAGDAFSCCYSLKGIDVAEDNAYYCAVDGVVYSEDGKTLIIYPCAKAAADIIIPEGVTHIGAGAFKDCTALKTITLPSSLLSIGASAFENSGITAISIPDTVTDIGEGAFSYCKGLTSAVLPDSLSKISEYCFYYSEKLTEVIIPEGLTDIGQSAFMYCDLSEIALPESLVSIGEYAFAGCTELKELILPDSVKEIESRAFQSCSGLSNVHLPASLSIIEQSVFSGCAALQDIEIPSSVTVIKDYAFFGCENLKNLTMSSRVKEIGGAAFLSCSALEEVEFAGTEAHWQAISIGKNNDALLAANVTYTGLDNSDGAIIVSFDANGGEIDAAGLKRGYMDAYGELPVPTREGYEFCGWFTKPAGGALVQTNYPVVAEDSHVLYAHWEDTIVDSGYIGTILWTVHSTGELSLYGSGRIPDMSAQTCPWWEEHSNVLSIDVDGTITGLGKNAFAMHNAAKSISLPDTLEYIGETAFWGCGFEEIVLPDGVKTIANYAFRSCDDLTSITLPEGLQYIGASAFGNYNEGLWVFPGCTALTQITIPDSVTYIGPNAFKGCRSLTTASTNCLSSGIFMDCTALEDLEVRSYYDNRIGENALSGCESLQTIYLPEGATSIGPGAFSNCTGLTSITIPEGVKEIGAYAFDGSINLEEINLPDSLVTIGRNAFSDLTGLKTINLGNQLQAIDVCAFSGCSSLEALEMPDTVVSIGRNAFSGCGSISTLKLSSRLEYIGKNAFSYCIGLDSVTIPDSVTQIDQFAFANCSGIKELSVSKSLRNIAGSSFIGCSSLEVLHLRGAVEEVSENAFSGCDSLATVYWYEDEAAWQAMTVAAGNEPLLNANLIIIGEPASYTVSFDANGGVVAQDSCEYEYGGTYGSLPLPEREGYEFRGWYTSLDGWVKVTETSYVEARNITLYARWWEPLVSGSCGDNAIWSLSNSGTLYIGGQGSIYDFKKAPWAEYSDRITQIQIGENINSIGAYAFYDCDLLTEVNIPDNVVSIGEYAFAECSNLSKVHCGENATNLGSHIFYYCTELQEVTLASELTAIPDFMFYDCKIKSVDLPDSVVEIGNHAFYNNGITEIELPSGLKAIGKYAFADNTSMTAITMPDGLETIGNYAFSRCTKLENLILPDTLTSLGQGAFELCMKLTEVTIPDGITELSKSVFSDCSNLVSVTLPESLKSIGDSAFSYCSKLTGLNIPAGVTKIGASAFKGMRALTGLILPEQLSTIERNTFQNCTSLNRIVIPAGVSRINYGAFSGCTGLTEIIFLGGAPATEANVNNQNGFVNVTGTAYYPDQYELETPNWTESNCSALGPSLTWQSWYTLGNTANCQHSYTTSEVGNACEGGYTLNSCACGYSYRSEFVTGPGHSYETVVTAPTCTEQGYTTHTCTTCGDSRKDEFIDAIGHSYTETVVDPTCTAQGYTSHVCSCGDSYEDNYKDALGHTEEVTIKGTEPGCTSTGLTDQVSCKTCGEILTAQEEIPATGHSEAVLPAVAPTCTESGLTEGSHCSACGEVFVAQETVDALGHTEVTDEAKDPDCTNNGLTEGSHCSTCGEVFVAQESIPALGHTEVVDKGIPPTCTSPGLSDGKHCSVCDAVLASQQPLDATGHSYDGGTVTVEPDCVNTGIKTFRCLGCGVEETEVLSALGHTPELRDEAAASCTAPGYTGDSYCAVCDELLSTGEEIPQLDHEFVNAVGENHIFTAATCAEAAVYFESCKGCGLNGENTFVSGEALGHLWDNDCDGDCNRNCGTTREVSHIPDTSKWEADVNGHWYACSSCGAQQSYEAHTPGAEATEETDQICTVCGFVIVPAHVHQHTLGYVDFVAATCQAEGNTAYWICSGCQCLFTDGEGLQPIEKSSTILAIDPNNHGDGAETVNQAAASCTVAGYTGDVVCKYCSTTISVGEVIEAPGHAWDSGTVTKEATHEEAGEMTYTCGTCGDTKTAEIPMLTGHKLTGTVRSWNTLSDAVFLLYDAGYADSAIRTDMSSAAPAYYTYIGVGGENTGNQSFSFEGVESGSYKLAVFKPGKYVPQIVQVTISADVDLGEIQLWLWGDVTNDGVLESGDALQIQRYIVGLPSTFGQGSASEEAQRLLAANVTYISDGDNMIESGDALQIQRYIVGLSSVFDSIA